MKFIIIHKDEEIIFFNINSLEDLYYNYEKSFLRIHTKNLRANFCLNCKKYSELIKFLSNGIIAGTEVFDLWVKRTQEECDEDTED